MNRPALALTMHEREPRLVSGCLSEPIVEETARTCMIVSLLKCVHLPVSVHAPSSSTTARLTNQSRKPDCCSRVTNLPRFCAGGFSGGRPKAEFVFSRPARGSTRNAGSRPASALPQSAAGGARLGCLTSPFSATTQRRACPESDRCCTWGSDESQDCDRGRSLPSCTSRYPVAWRRTRASRPG